MAEAGTSGKLEVFISYSRRDSLDFADQIDSALKACGFNTILDRHGISGGDDWQRRLGDLILSADTIVFVMSPESAVSEICAWEVEEAYRLSKRILPIITTDLGGALPPERLQKLNYIHFYAEKSVPGSGFGSGLMKLTEALNTDLGWVREHSRIGLLAASWEGAGRPVNRLLTGPDIESAKNWLGAQRKSPQEATELHRAFIAASEEAERARVAREKAQEATARDGEIKRLVAEQEAQRLTLEAGKLKAEQQAAVAEARRRRSQMLLAIPTVLLLAGAGSTWVWIDRTRNFAEANRIRAEAAETAKRLAERDKETAQLQAELEKAKREAVAAGGTKQEAVSAENQGSPTTGLALLTPEEASLRISDAAVSMMLLFEVDGRVGYDRRYHHPVRPPDPSGITIGVSYDLGYVTEDEFTRDWKTLLDTATFEKLLPAVGKMGPDAQAILDQVKGLDIPWDAAQVVFREKALTKYGALVDKIFPNAKELPPDSYGALVSLVFNRGAKLDGDRRVEMRNIKTLMEQRKFDAIPAEIRNMKRLYNDALGLLKRRNAEAILFEKGLVGSKKI
jgi:hypothetical protein